MFDFSAINEAKKITKANYDRSEQEFNFLIQEALDSLDTFLLSPCFDYDNLSDSMNTFVEAIEIKKNRVEPYFYLSYIFYLLNDLDQAVNYLFIATNLNNQFEGLAELRENINNKISENLKLLSDTDEETIVPENNSTAANTLKKVQNTVNQYNQQQIKAYSTSFKDRIYKMALK